MKKNTLALSLAVAFVLQGSAQAEERKYRDQISGTAAPSSFEIKGKKAHYVTFSGLSILGPIHGGLLVLKMTWGPPHRILRARVIQRLGFPSS